MSIRNATIGTFVLAVALALAWWLGFLGGTDPVLAELQQMRDQMFSSGDLPEAQRDQLRDQFRERLAGLSDDQRRALFEGARDQWRQRGRERMDEFFALPKNDQRKQLDESINRLLQRRNQPRVAANDRGGRRGGDGGRGRNMTPAQRDARAKQRLDRSSPKERAQRSEYRRQMRERMQERGINPDTLPGRRRLA